MKISSSTSTTSTSGMMLISASDAPTGRRPPAPGPTLNAIFGRPRGLGRRPREPVEQLQREPLHLRRPVLDPVDEVVVGHDRRNRRPEPRRRRDQRLGDARRHHRQARRALLADPLEGRDDPPRRAEQPDERTGTRRRGQKRQVALEPRDLERRHPPQRPLHRLQSLPRQPLLLALLPQRAGHFREPPELLVARHVELGERTLAELLRCRVHQRRPPTLARRPLKGRRLLPHLPELPPLLDDQRPAQDREHPEDHQDALGHRPRFGDQLHHCPARRVEHRRTPSFFSSTISDAFQRSQIFHRVSSNKASFSLTLRRLPPYKEVVVSAVSLLLLALAAAPASAVDARTAVEAFVSRLTHVSLADMTVTESFVLYDRDGRSEQAAGERPLVVKVPPRDRGEETLE